jgi:hypothetical protein
MPTYPSHVAGIIGYIFSHFLKTNKQPGTSGSLTSLILTTQEAEIRKMAV